MHERSIHVEYTPDFEQMTRKKRVAAYARVSTDKDEAVHSLSAQISYFNRLIASHSDWEFVEIFTDEGFTGTKANRPGFQRMLEACREGRIDMILAKSITRFARNTVTLLETARELKALNIDIYFEEERLHTLSAKGELLLSVFAARAQEESRSASENQKWRIRKKYEKGEPVNGNALGYRLVDGTFWIDEEEEPIVKRIFVMYLKGMGKIAIAKKLNAEGIPTRLKRSAWSPNSVYTILNNEKYQGDLRLQKSYITDHISKKQVRNKGERPVYQVEDAHEAIIDRTIFDRVQEEQKRRAKKFNATGTLVRYPFSSMVLCGKCGHHYVRKTAHAGSKYEKHVWLCGTYDKFSTDGCSGQQIPEGILTTKTCELLGLKEMDEEILRSRIAEIVVPEKNVLVFRFKDGSEQRMEWQHQSRSKSWTPEMKERARQQTKKRWKEKKQC